VESSYTHYAATNNYALNHFSMKEDVSLFHISKHIKVCSSYKRKKATLYIGRVVWKDRKQKVN